MNSEIKKELKQMHGIDECLSFLRRALVKYTTVFNVNYTDYDNISFTQQIKAYKGGKDEFIIVFTDFDNNQVSHLKVYFAKEEPRKPHPVFPLARAITTSTDYIEFDKKGD